MATSTVHSDKSDLMSLQELAQCTGRHYVTLWELARRDELPLPIIRFGKRLFVSRRAYDALLNAQHEQDQPQIA